MRIRDIIIDALTLIGIVGTIYGLGLIAWAVQ